MWRRQKIKGILYLFLVTFTLSAEFTSAQLEEHGMNLYKNRRVGRLKNKSPKQKLWAPGTLDNDRKLSHERSQKYNMSVRNKEILRERSQKHNMTVPNKELIRERSQTYNMPVRIKELLRETPKTYNMPVRNKELLRKRSETYNVPFPNKELLRERPKTYNMPVRNKELLRKRSETYNVPFPNKELLREGSQTYNMPVRNKELLRERSEKYNMTVQNISGSVVESATPKASRRLATVKYHSDISKENLKLCQIIASTYLASYPDLRAHYNLRYFYQGNYEYEAGYLVNDILTKYQRMLEIFHIAQNRYYKKGGKFYIKTNYLLYLYTNMLTLGKSTGHMVNTLTELEIKYKAFPPTGFEDYHIGKKKKKKKNGTNFDIPPEFQESIDEYERKLRNIKKQRKRKRKRDRLQNLYIGYWPTTPVRKPNSSGKWPIEYGWSIEHIW
ncbi:unnamed protein product [Spodoptera littoralis]|uniref:Uncharacterized protein n=1 Tax=Spodoptera littoralis TaxID=7109 RepID=A0A9P0I847_SPOLI|nr:unnamed protein product [Spodoptera littoralis]CAH1641126.1 unnamed protein product [Spodoptera littoralis]